jgi:hypothetical protein
MARKSISGARISVAVISAPAMSIFALFSVSTATGHFFAS